MYSVLCMSYVYVEHASDEKSCVCVCECNGKIRGHWTWYIGRVHQMRNSWALNLVMKVLRRSREKRIGSLGKSMTTLLMTIFSYAWRFSNHKIQSAPMGGQKSVTKFANSLCILYCTRSRLCMCGGACMCMSLVNIWLRQPHMNWIRVCAVHADDSLYYCCSSGAVDCTQLHSKIHPTFDFLNWSKYVSILGLTIATIKQIYCLWIALKWGTAYAVHQCEYQIFHVISEHRTCNSTYIRYKSLNISGLWRWPMKYIQKYVL